MAMLINECLCFTTKQYDKLNKVNLTSSLDFYQLKVLVDAKEILVTEYENVGDANNIKSFKIKRKENSPGAKSKVIKDILDIWDVVDTTLGGKLGVSFVAADPNLLPSVSADQFNLQFLIGAINKLQDEVKQQRGSLEGISQSLTTVHSQQWILRQLKTKNPQIRRQKDEMCLFCSPEHVTREKFIRPISSFLCYTEKYTTLLRY